MKNDDHMQTGLQCINLLILRMSHRVLKTYDDAYRDFGVKATQLPVLNLLAEYGVTSMKNMSSLTATERSVLSRKLQIMEKNGWIQSNKNSSTREKLFQLTESGEMLVEETRHVRQQVQQELMEQLSQDEQRLLLSICDKLQANYV